MTLKLMTQSSRSMISASVKGNGHSHTTFILKMFANFIVTYCIYTNLVTTKLVLKNVV